MNRFFFFLMLVGLCLAIALFATTGCGNNGPVAPTTILLDSPEPNSTWWVGDTLDIHGTYILQGAPAPEGEQIGVVVFQWPEDGGASIRGDTIAIVGDAGEFYVEIEINNWQADRYIVQCTTEDGLLYYESPRFNIVGESH